VAFLAENPDLQPKIAALTAPYPIAQVN